MCYMTSNKIRIYAYDAICVFCMCAVSDVFTTYFFDDCIPANILQHIRIIIASVFSSKDNSNIAWFIEDQVKRK